MEAIEKMPFDSTSLHPVRLGNAIFYCFLEARRNLFSSSSDEYLNNLVICLGIKILFVVTRKVVLSNSSFHLKLALSGY